MHRGIFYYQRHSICHQISYSDKLFYSINSSNRYSIKMIFWFNRPFLLNCVFCNIVSDWSFHHILKNIFFSNKFIDSIFNLKKVFIFVMAFRLKSVSQSIFPIYLGKLISNSWHHYSTTKWFSVLFCRLAILTNKIGFSVILFYWSKGLSKFRQYCFKLYELPTILL